MFGKKDNPEPSKPIVTGRMEIKRTIETTHRTVATIESYCCQEMYESLQGIMITYSDDRHLYLSEGQIILSNSSKTIKFCPFCGARLPE